jgi:RNA polymerase sigma-70 factor (ECF subfamily)
MTALTRTGRWPPGLIDAARCGDEKALLSLISAAQPDVRRYAARNCRAADIDDAVQETLLLLYRRIGTLRAVSSFSAWLFAVARRACHRLLRMSIGLPDDLPDAVEARLAHLRMSIDEIAGALGLTRESAKARLHRARIMIREYLIRD